MGQITRYLYYYCVHFNKGVIHTFATLFKLGSFTDQGERLKGQLIVAHLESHHPCTSETIILASCFPLGFSTPEVALDIFFFELQSLCGTHLHGFWAGSILGMRWGGLFETNYVCFENKRSKKIFTPLTNSFNEIKKVCYMAR